MIALLCLPKSLPSDPLSSRRANGVTCTYPLAYNGQSAMRLPHRGGGVKRDD
jgi:hypothetical protein